MERGVDGGELGGTGGGGVHDRHRVPVSIARHGSTQKLTCRAQQCGNATVTWSGDDGPWHLLLTPTDIVEHGYNVSLERQIELINSFGSPRSRPTRPTGRYRSDSRWA
jgi:hypothetical protein